MRKMIQNGHLMLEHIWTPDCAQVTFLCFYAFNLNFRYKFLYSFVRKKLLDWYYLQGSQCLIFGFGWRTLVTDPLPKISLLSTAVNATSGVRGKTSASVYRPGLLKLLRLRDFHHFQDSKYSVDFLDNFTVFKMMLHT